MRRRRVLTRALPFALTVSAVAFTGGLVCAATRQEAGRATAERFAKAWSRGDYATMYSQLTDEARRRTSLKAFLDIYRGDEATAAARALETGRPRSAGGGAYRVPVRVSTRIFGTVDGAVVLPMKDDGGAKRIDWARNLAFPGLEPGEALTRSTELPPRAAILARDKTVLAEGSARTSPLGPLAASVVGQLGEIPAESSDRLYGLGVPRGAKVGVSGLERIFDTSLRGRPGGQLREGTRTIARSTPRAATAVRTTISVPVQRAAVAALGPRLGGVVAVKPRTGEILAFAGIAFSGLQPPGSTFKIVTATAALQAGLTTPATQYPVQTSAVLEGVQLDNANGEACGGTFAHAFAVSCNSVFAPLGAQLGAKRLVAAAQRFGFNSPADIPGAAESSIPAADEIGDDLAVGSSAIGQGQVQASTLQMTSIAATIGLRGRRPRLTLRYDPTRRAARTRRATYPKTARTVEKLMLGVVSGGTGTAAAIPGVEVAGKTGTAELKDTMQCHPDPENPGACPAAQQAPDPTNTDAWFVAYAPAGHGKPKIAVGVLLVASGAGGATAAPSARGVLEVGLHGPA